MNYLKMYSDEQIQKIHGASLEILAKTGQLGAYRHGGFWQPMDTLRDKQVLEAMWINNNAPWKCW